MDLTPFIEAGKKNFAKANERRKKEAEERRAVEQGIKDAKAALKQIKDFGATLRKRIKADEAARLSTQHGVTVGDYYRCKKTNGQACDVCKKRAAEYRRQQISKDPFKFKEQKKASLRRNGASHKNRDRAKKRGVKTEYYTRKQIFDRDGMDCYLCNIPVDLTAPHVQGQPGWEMYPHIEHVIPFALGGTDTLDNVKIAHAKCNIDKGVKATA